MAPVDGLILMKIYTNHPLMPDVNISKDEPFKSKGQGAVGEQRSKNAATLKIYRCFIYIQIFLCFSITYDHNFVPSSKAFYLNSSNTIKDITRVYSMSGVYIKKTKILPKRCGT